MEKHPKLFCFQSIRRPEGLTLEEGIEADAFIPKNLSNKTPNIKGTHAGPFNIYWGEVED
jgi:hypothetical protein